MDEREHVRVRGERTVRRLVEVRVRVSARARVRARVRVRDRASRIRVSQP